MWKGENWIGEKKKRETSLNIFFRLLTYVLFALIVNIPYLFYVINTNTRYKRKKKVLCEWQLIPFNIITV